MIPAIRSLLDSCSESSLPCSLLSSEVPHLLLGDGHQQLPKPSGRGPCSGESFLELYPLGSGSQCTAPGITVACHVGSGTVPSVLFDSGNVTAGAISQYS